MALFLRSLRNLAQEKRLTTCGVSALQGLQRAPRQLRNDHLHASATQVDGGMGAPEFRQITLIYVRALDASILAQSAKSLADYVQPLDADIDFNQALEELEAFVSGRPS